MTEPGAISLDKVSRTYGDGATAVPALRDVSTEIRAGSFVAIVGPSGSGKSTMLNLLGALDRPSAGRVTVAGVDLGALDDDGRTIFRRDRLGFVFQFFNLLPTLTALENVALPARLAGRDAKQTRARAGELLERVGLAERSAHTPEKLSGGEMQRVAVARALMMDPPVVLADEPTGNLDTKTGETVLALLRGAVDAARTVVLVTHDSKIAARAERVLRIVDGRIVEDAKPEAYPADGAGGAG
jgi:putative ABC transport system ATP-binding protein